MYTLSRVQPATPALHEAFSPAHQPVAVVLSASAYKKRDADYDIIQQMLGIFRHEDRQLRDQVQQLAKELDQLRADMNMRVQQVEEECVRIRLQRALREIHRAAELAVRIGLPAALAIEKAFRALAAPLPPGKAGGIVRARNAWRYSDGTFMPESVKLEFYQQEYEHHAAGGRARAASAKRAPDGTFLR